MSLPEGAYREAQQKKKLEEILIKWQQSGDGKGKYVYHDLWMTMIILSVWGYKLQELVEMSSKLIHEGFQISGDLVPEIMGAEIQFYKMVFVKPRTNKD